MSSLDEKILKRIRENEKEYHEQVVKYLKQKEIELRTII